MTIKPNEAQAKVKVEYAGDPKLRANQGHIHEIRHEYPGQGDRA